MVGGGGRRWWEVVWSENGGWEVVGSCRLPSRHRNSGGCPRLPSAAATSTELELICRHATVTEVAGINGEKGGGFDVVEVVVVLFFWCVSSKVFLGFGYFSHFVHPWLLEFFSLGTALMSGGGLFLQTQNHPLKGYFVLLRWMLPPPEPGPVDHCKPPSEPALPEKSGGPGGLGMLFDFFFVGFLLIFGYVLDFFDGFCVLLGWLMLMGASVGLLLLIFLWVL
ncbi:hypothetical protein HanPSC8_Chr13g0548291 [Helianthus annuus]|nr:hypothetical protein HanPSC8_Chr13g0548291 [Helianthus annuus]